MSAIEAQQLFWTVAVSHAHDGESETIGSSLIYRTRVEAVQALWIMIVDNKFYFPNVIYMWKELFDIIENDDVYDETSEDYNHEDYVLIRKLITPEMNTRIQTILDQGNQIEDQGYNPKRKRYNEDYEKKYEQMNIEFDYHLRSVHMTEEEIENFMKNYSECSEEFGAGSQILTSWDIRKVSISQQAQQAKNAS